MSVGESLLKCLKSVRKSWKQRIELVNKSIGRKLIALQKGFTLIELLITIAIVSILAAIAIPSYQNYTLRARFSELVLATAPWKLAVNQCYQSTGALTNCNNGANGIPPAPPAAGQVASVATAAGVITVTPNATNGFVAGDTYILTPTVSGNTLTWTASGGGVTKGYAT